MCPSTLGFKVIFHVPVFAFLSPVHSIQIILCCILFRNIQMLLFSFFYIYIEALEVIWIVSFLSWEQTGDGSGDGGGGGFCDESFMIKFWLDEVDEEVK